MHKPQIPHGGLLYQVDFPKALTKLIVLGLVAVSMNTLLAAGCAQRLGKDEHVVFMETNCKISHSIYAFKSRGCSI